MPSPNPETTLTSLTALSVAPGALPLMPAAVQINVLHAVVISSDPLIASALTAGLEARGHLASAATPNESTGLLDRIPLPDVALWHLNHRTATEAAEFLRLLHQKPGTDCAVIALTDTDEPLPRVEAWLRRGIDDFHTLPSLSASHDALATKLAVLEQTLLRRRQRAHLDTNAVTAIQRYEDIFQKSPEAALIVGSKDGLILEGNAAAALILGIPRPELLNRYLSLVLPDLFDREDYDPKTLAISDTLRLTEIRHQRADQTAAGSTSSSPASHGLPARPCSSNSTTSPSSRNANPAASTKPASTPPAASWPAPPANSATS